MVPVGAHVINPVGTAPGVVVPGKPTIVVLPGPPRELQPMWPVAVETDAVQQAIAGRTTYRQDMVRMFGLPESGLADSLRDAEQSIDGFDRLEITTCLRRGEVEMVTRYEPDAAGIYVKLMELLRERHGRPDLLRRRLARRRPDRAAAGRPPDRDGRILHRRAAGRPADGAAGFVGLRRRRCRRLCERGEDRAARRRT